MGMSCVIWTLNAGIQFASDRLRRQSILTASKTWSLWAYIGYVRLRLRRPRIMSAAAAAAAAKAVPLADQTKGIKRRNIEAREKKRLKRKSGLRSEEKRWEKGKRSRWKSTSYRARSYAAVQIEKKAKNEFSKKLRQNIYASLGSLEHPSAAIFKQWFYFRWIQAKSFPSQ